MDQITKVKKRLKQEQWKALIKECQSSKMTISSWCKANGICEQTYHSVVVKHFCNSMT